MAGRMRGQERADYSESNGWRSWTETDSDGRKALVVEPSKRARKRMAVLAARHGISLSEFLTLAVTCLIGKAQG